MPRYCRSRPFSLLTASHPGSFALRLRFSGLFPVDPFADVGWAVRQLNSPRITFAQELDYLQVHYRYLAEIHDYVWSGCIQLRD